MLCSKWTFNFVFIRLLNHTWYNRIKLNAFGCNSIYCLISLIKKENILNLWSVKGDTVYVLYTLYQLHCFKVKYYKEMKIAQHVWSIIKEVWSFSLTPFLLLLLPYDHEYFFTWSVTHLIDPGYSQDDDSYRGSQNVKEHDHVDCRNVSGLS